MEVESKNLKRGICILKCENNHEHGIVLMKELSVGGPVHFYVFIENIAHGLHGIHIHQSGDVSEGPKSLCSHYNPYKKEHGGLNDPNAHMGDLGNIYADEFSQAETEFVADYVRLRGEHSVFGRSIVVHEDEDDLGKGEYEDSKTTGHSGKRILWGIIGVNEVSFKGKKLLKKK